MSHISQPLLRLLSAGFGPALGQYLFPVYFHFTAQILVSHFKFDPRPHSTRDVKMEGVGDYGWYNS